MTRTHPSHRSHPRPVRASLRPLPRSLHLLNGLGVLALLLASMQAPAIAGESTWMNDASDAAPRLTVQQAIWAMGGLPRGGDAWSREEQVAKIAEADFDGFMLFLSGPDESRQAWKALAEKHGLEITALCRPASAEDMRRNLASAKALGARALVAMVRPTFVTFEEGAEKIRTLMAEGRKAGLPVYLETHRGTITQDLMLTARWAAEIPGVQLHGDLSHLVVCYGFGRGGDPVAKAYDAILARVGMLDGRISNGQQVQIDVGPGGEHPAAKGFQKMWTRAMTRWLENAGPGDIFLFKPELGPPPYSILGLDGEEISDRWAQALVIRELGIAAWNEAVRNTGKGQAYEVSDAKKTAAKPGDEAQPAAWLEPKPSEFRTLRGECFRLGEDLFLSGQPAQPDYEEAGREGIKTIINVRMKKELIGLGFPVRDTVELAGMKYVHIPVAPDTLDDALAKEFIEAVDRAERPLMIHGSNGNRLWGLWALYLGAKFGTPIEETRKVAQSVGIKRLVVDEFAAGFIERYRK